MTEAELNIIKSISNKYKEEEKSSNKLNRLIALDKSVTTAGMVLALSLGIIGILIFGLGMCLCLLWTKYFLGILVGIVGVVLMSLSMPLRNKAMLKKRKEVSKEILDLSSEMLSE